MTDSKVKGRGRIDRNNLWGGIRKEWLAAFEIKEIADGKSMLVAMKPEDEWCVEAFLQVDYGHIDRAAIAREMRRYVAYEILNEEV